MKRKKAKKSRKISKRGKIILSSIYILIASLSAFFFFKSYQYISDIPEADNLTQEEIYSLTRIEETDIKVIRAVKNDAFDSWLYEANDDKVKELPKTQEIVLNIVKGKIDVPDIDDVITDLKEGIEIIKESDTEELYELYYSNVLPKQYEKANTAFQEMTVERPEDHYKEILALLDLLNKIYNQKGMSSVVNNQIFKESVSLLDDINNNFTEVNQIKSMVVNFDTLNTVLPDPETKLGMELDEYVFKVNDYLESKIMVREFETRYSELQSNLSTNELLIDKSIKMPDLVGLSVEKAQRELRQSKINYTIKGYTNESYRNGEKVPETQREIETWDDDKQGKIIKQEPSNLEYDYIIEGATIQIIVENKPIKKPEESSDSSSESSSSTSDSSTSSSSETEETSSSTENSYAF